MKLWEEKNSTDQWLNLLKNVGKDNFDTITEIKNVLIKKDSTDTINRGIYLIVSELPTHSKADGWVLRSVL